MDLKLRYLFFFFKQLRKSLLQGSQARRIEDESQKCLPKGEEVGVLMVPEGQSEMWGKVTGGRERGEVMGVLLGSIQLQTPTCN